MNVVARPPEGGAPPVGRDTAARALAATVPAAYARVRVGRQALAIPAEQVLQAGPWPADGLLPVPRRGGALAGMCHHDGGLLPVVALERWCPIATDVPDAPATPGDDRRLLVLRCGSALVGLAADAVLGVSPAPAAGPVRLHHEDEEHELFQSAVMLGGEATCVLEVGRLTRLARVWAERARLHGDAPDAAAAADAGAGAAGPDDLARPVPHAILSAGGLLAALPVQHLRQVVPAPALEIDFGRGAVVRGLCQWSQRKLPVIDLAQRLCATPPAGPLPRWMAVLSVDGAMAGLLIDEACQLLPLPPSAPADDAGLPPGLLPPRMTALGAVQPLDVAALLDGMPMAVQPGAAAAGAATTAARGSPAYLVFEADGVYASPVDGIAAIVPLPPDSARRLLAGEGSTLAWRDQLLPLQLLPRYGGAGAPQQLPELAVVLAPAGARPTALAIGRLVSWVPANTATTAGMRMAAVGELQMISVGRPGAAASYMVLDLAQLAFLLN
ncbi:chemotaxis protein CheW [Aquincola tertiaricarbonis]|uniref:chemotaxis protein CheW n=1 Tax=Aquincola tertiaricarbonis TaxID=391953 RepID=UPI0018DC5937|nr:chemotaxis protein CheW [Aquincola tertiaricarbonis]